MADTALLEQVVIGGDLSKLSSSERLVYYKSVCESLGLNPLTRPLEYIVLNGKLTLYARKDATDQLRQSRGVSITRLEREMVEGVYVVTAYARDKAGREDSSIGAVGIANLKGDILANAMMKAETKAKRRVTLSICGLGMLDETEIETIPGAKTPTNAELREAVDEVLEAELPTAPELVGPAAMAAAKSMGVTKGVLSKAKAADLHKLLGGWGFSAEDQAKLAAAMAQRDIQSFTELTLDESKAVWAAAKNINDGRAKMEDYVQEEQNG